MKAVNEKGQARQFNGAGAWVRQGPAGKRPCGRLFQQKGQSPLISAILYLLVSIIVVSIVLQVGVPYLNRLQEYGEIKNIESTIKELDETISVVAAEGEDSQRRVTISLAKDAMDVNGTSEMITVSIDTDARVMNPRTRKSQGNYFKGVNLKTDAYSSTLSDINVLVLENEHIYFAVLKLDSNTEMKPYGLVKMVRFKGGPVDMNALLDFYMDSHAGEDVNISTEFTKGGYNLGWGEIKAAVYGSGYQFNVKFRLESGADFIRIRASDAVWS